MRIFLKGIVVGLGAVAPGLSGSVLLVIFGLFLSVVPTVFDESCVLGWNATTFVSFAIMAVSFVASLLFSNLQSIKEK